MDHAGELLQACEDGTADKLVAPPDPLHTSSRSSRPASSHCGTLPSYAPVVVLANLLICPIRTPIEDVGRRSYRRLALASTIVEGTATPRSTRRASTVRLSSRDHATVCGVTVSRMLMVCKGRYYPKTHRFLGLPVSTGHIEIVDLLLAAGANATLTDENGGTPLVTYSRRSRPAHPSVARRNKHIGSARHIGTFPPVDISAGHCSRAHAAPRSHHIWTF
eukprot:3898179-Pyramimonas_sp.AAC.2